MYYYIITAVSKYVAQLEYLGAKDSAAANFNDRYLLLSDSNLYIRFWSRTLPVVMQAGGYLAA